MSVSNAKTLTVLPESTGLTRRFSLWIYTGAGPQMGFGHLRRCIVLAKSLYEYCNPLFILDPEDLWSQEQLERLGFECCVIKLNQVWSLQQQPIAILLDTRISDGLAEFVVTAREKGICVLSIHDLGLNPLPSDIVIDGSVLPMLQENVFSYTKIFSGMEFIVLDPAFRILHLRSKPINKEIRSILINLGGGDSRKYYLRVLAGLKEWDHEVEVIGLRGFIQWGQDSLITSDWAQVHFRWESGPAFQYIGDADVVITAGGLSAYEALCTGAPLMALAYDSLQQTTIKGLESLGGCINLGLGDALDPARLAEALTLIENDHDKRVKLSSRGRFLVDGLGDKRVSEIIRQSIHESGTIDYARAGK
jgi:spore coat polysaccharide biosynthesis predicted glycosyltransferase SpsG